MENLKKKYQEKYFDKTDLFTLVAMVPINHQPHPYCLGAEHIERYHIDTTKPCAMRVHPETKEWSTAYKKGYVKCNLPFEEHTYEVAMILQLKKDTDENEVGLFIHNMSETFLVDNITEIAFEETPNKYKIHAGTPNNQPDGNVEVSG